MKKLFLLSILFIFNYSVFGQRAATNDTIPRNNKGLSIVGKLGYGRIWESGNAPLYGFTTGIDGLYTIELKDRKHPKERSYLQTGLGYLEFDGNRTTNGNTVTLRNEYLQIPLKFKNYQTLFEDQSKSHYLQSSTAFGLYANTLLTQRIESTAGNTSSIYLGWNYGITFQWGLKYTVADKTNFELGWQFQGDLRKMNKNGIQRKTDYVGAFYLEFNFF